MPKEVAATDNHSSKTHWFKNFCQYEQDKLWVLHQILLFVKVSLWLNPVVDRIKLWAGDCCRVFILCNRRWRISELDFVSRRHVDTLTALRLDGP